jgi:hypothetical protein
MPMRKTVMVDQELLDRPGAILGTPTDAETITQALEQIVFREEVVRGIREIAGSRSMRDIFSDDA